MSAPIRQDADFDASPQRLYAALLDSAEFAAMTGAPAEIDARPGGAFSCFGGMISGRIIELVPERRIVQAWRVGAWPEGVYSLVRFDLEPRGAGASLALEHSAYPEGSREHLAAGWQTNYLTPLTRHLG